jgi:hypothetical protein
MQKTMVRAEESGQLNDDEFDDIECELSCSAREAGVGFASFTNLDFMRAAMEYAQIQARKVKEADVDPRSVDEQALTATDSRPKAHSYLGNVHPEPFVDGVRQRSTRS